MLFECVGRFSLVKQELLVPISIDPCNLSRALYDLWKGEL